MFKKMYLLFVGFCFFNFAYAEYEVSNTSWPYTLSKGYCVITHPVEWWGTVQKADENPDIRRNATCEKQHIIQQQSSYSYLDNKDKANTVFWAESYHSRTDRWNDKPWENKHPFWSNAGFTKDASRGLYEAYMLGTWGLSYSIFKHDYNGADSTLIIFDNDGISNVLYSFSYIINLPQKYINQWVYILDKERYSLSIDLVLAIPILIFEIVLAMVMGGIGFITGLILNPIDTIMAIPGGIVYAIDTSITAVWNTVLGLFRLVTVFF